MNNFTGKKIKKAQFQENINDGLKEKTMLLLNF